MNLESPLGYPFKLLIPLLEPYREVPPVECHHSNSPYFLRASMAPSMAFSSPKMPRISQSAMRKTFALQQSLEKLIKSSYPVFSGSLRNFPTMMSISPLVQGRDVFGDEAYKELSSRISSQLAGFADPKSLRHNPAERLRQRSTLDTLIRYSNDIGADKELVGLVSITAKLLGSMNERELVKRSLEAYAAAITRSRLLRDYVKTRPVGKYTGEPADYLMECVLPNYAGIINLLVSFYCLLDFLSKFEQSSRYPDGPRVPRSLLSYLDEVENGIRRYYSFVLTIYKEDGITDIVDHRFFRGMKPRPPPGQRNRT